MMDQYNLLPVFNGLLTEVAKLLNNVFAKRILVALNAQHWVANGKTQYLAPSLATERVA